MSDEFDRYNPQNPISTLTYSIDELMQSLGFKQSRGKWQANDNPNTRGIQEMVNNQRNRRSRKKPIVPVIDRAVKPPSVNTKPITVNIGGVVLKLTRIR